MANMDTNSIPTAQIEQIVIKIMKSRFQDVMEEYVQKNELRAKELALMERVVRVEEELRSLREMSEAKFEISEKRFEALQREMNGRFEALQREMSARFEAVDKRFESMDKRFSMVQWMIGILVGIPAITFTIIQLVKIL